MSDKTTSSMFQRCLYYVLVFFLCIVICSIALFLVGLLPQSAISTQIKDSAVLFEKEGCYPQISQSRESYQLDNFSDALMITHSYYMDTKTTPSSVFSNPRYYDGIDPVTSIIQISESDPAANWNYAHYWMGFRVPLRLLLTVMNYSQIRIVITWIFILLFCSVILFLSNRLGKLIALLFAVAVVSCNIIVIAVSLQFSCCYIISFLGILAVLRFAEKRHHTMVIFLLLGQLTQYFDFYTTPIITYGLPMVVLLLIGYKEGWITRIRDSFEIVSKCFLAWILAYAGMWVARMALVTIFTPINGFHILESFACYTGLIDTANHASTILTAFQKAFWVFISTPTVLALCACSVILLVLLIKKHKGLRSFRIVPSSAFLALALLPIIWISVSAEAFIVHYWFQYRSLSLTVFSAYCFLYQSLPATENNVLKIH